MSSDRYQLIFKLLSLGTMSDNCLPVIKFHLPCNIAEHVNLDQDLSWKDNIGQFYTNVNEGTGA